MQKELGKVRCHPTNGRYGKRIGLAKGKGEHTTTVQRSRVDSALTIAHVADTIESIGRLLRGRVDGHFRTRIRGLKRSLGGCRMGRSSELQRSTSWKVAHKLKGCLRVMDNGLWDGATSIAGATLDEDRTLTLGPLDGSPRRRRSVRPGTEGA
jgi:hypothetical protein